MASCSSLFDPVPKVIFVTHPEVAVDPSTDVCEWSLSTTGRSRARSFASAPILGRVEAIFSSTEVKAAQTAALLAQAAALPYRSLAELGENDRSATGFLPAEEFETAADAFFASPALSYRGWESAMAAQKRIVSVVNELLNDADSGTGDVLIVSHGAVGTLLLCWLLSVPISRDHDQPRQGSYFAFARRRRTVLHSWVPLEHEMVR